MTPHINLYDASLRLQRDWLNADTALAGGAAALLLVLAAVGWVQAELARLLPQARQQNALLLAQQTALVEATRSAANSRPNAQLQARLQVAQASLQQRHSALELLHSGAMGRAQGHAAALEGLARQSADGLWLTGVTLDAQQVALRGRALAPEMIPAYVTRLNREPALAGQAFRAMQLDRPWQTEPAANAAAGTASGTSAAQPAPATTTAAVAKATPAAFVEFSLVSAQGVEAAASMPAPGAVQGAVQGSSR